MIDGGLSIFKEFFFVNFNVEDETHKRIFFKKV